LFDIIFKEDTQYWIYNIGFAYKSRTFKQNFPLFLKKAIGNSVRTSTNMHLSQWVEAMRRFQDAAELVVAEQRMKKTMWGQFWSAHQRFFKYLCIAAKVKHAVQLARYFNLINFIKGYKIIKFIHREAIKYGKCVVIGLQSTGEARTLEQLEKDDGELSDFVSTAK
jgi:hypothetical protein